MLPHEQLVVESVRRERGFTSRLWSTASYHEHTRNVRPGALPVAVDLGVPFGETMILNNEQLVDAIKVQEITV
jgi:hypothetical protein